MRFAAALLTAWLCVVAARNPQPSNAYPGESWGVSWAEVSTTGSPKDVLRWLSTHPTDLDVEINDSEQTALMANCLSGRADVVLALLNAGADPSIGEKDGYTCAHGVGFQGRASVVEKTFNLLNFSESHEDGFSPLHRACWGKKPRHVDTIKALVEVAKVDVDSMAKNGDTALAQAMRHGNARSAGVLLKLGADVEKLPDEEFKKHANELLVELRDEEL